MLHPLGRVVNERESRALPTTVLRPEAETADLVFLAFVEFTQLVAELIFGYVRAVGMKDVTVWNQLG